MKHLRRKTFFELISLCLLAFGLVAIAEAQDDVTPQKKVKVEIEVTENGITSKSIQELEFSTENINRKLEDMVGEIEVILEEAMEDIEETDLEVIIKKNFSEWDEPRFKGRMRTLHDHHHEDGSSEPRAFLGVIARSLEEEERAAMNLESGVRIEEVVEESSAQRAGLKDGDILERIDGVSVNSFKDVARSIRAHEPGDEVQLDLIRDGQAQQSTAELGEMETNDIDISFEWDDEEGNSEHWHYPPHLPQAPHHIRQRERIERKAFLGVEASTNEENGGVEVTKVFEGSSAEEMGIQEGDVIHEINKEEIEDLDDLVHTLAEYEVDDEVKINYEREGKKGKTNGKLKAIPEAYRFIPKPQREQEKYVFRIEVETVDEDDIKELEEKSGSDLDESNSLDLRHFNVSPNPSEGVFIVDAGLEKEGEVKIQVFDMNGRQVYESIKEADADILLERIDLGEEESGMYFISVMQNGKGKTSRVLKQ